MSEKVQRLACVRLFKNDAEARFVRRPNRFLIIAEKDGEELLCHCPNPGRLSELLFPGTRLILEKRGNPKGRTTWTAAALKKGQDIVPLFSSRANEAAEKLLLPLIIPGLKEIRREFKIGDSRFDFFCTDEDEKKHLIEVKACSLVEHGVAMFPDAPSARALKHLEELSFCSNYECHVLFVILHGKPKKFIPNLHTDPAFAGALCKYGREIKSINTAGQALHPPPTAASAAELRGIKPYFDFARSVMAD
jgi:sugar fermentation stimulation protein A